MPVSRGRRIGYAARDPYAPRPFRPRRRGDATPDVTLLRQEAQMPAGSVSEVAEPHPTSPLGLTSFGQPSVSLVADGLPTGASMADTGVDCARCGGRGGVYLPSLCLELSCPECG